MYRLPIKIKTNYDYDLHRKRNGFNSKLAFSKEQLALEEVNNMMLSYSYGFNGMEKDDEVSGNGNHYTTPFRGYNPRLGRWMSTDPLHNLAPGWNSYRFGFDNPVVFMDKKGLFETKKEARQYKKDNGLKGEIHKSDDGIYSIDNEKAGTSMFKDASLDDFAISTRQDDGVIVDALVTAEGKGINSNNDLMTYGNREGLLFIGNSKKESTDMSYLNYLSTSFTAGATYVNNQPLGGKYASGVSKATEASAKKIISKSLSGLNYGVGLVNAAYITNDKNSGVYGDPDNPNAAYYIEHGVNVFTTFAKPQYSIPATLSYSAGKTTMQNGTALSISAKILYHMGFSVNAFNTAPPTVEKSKELLNK